MPLIAAVKPSGPAATAFNGISCRYLACLPLHRGR